MPTYSGTTDVQYAPTCEEIIRNLVSVDRKVKKGGVESVVTGLVVGQNGGLAFPTTPEDRGTVETFRDFVEQLRSEGLAEAAETEVMRPSTAVGIHHYLIREPLAGEDIGQFVRLDIYVKREEGHAGKLQYEAWITHSCKSDKQLKAENSAETDIDLWTELGRIFLG